MISIDPSPPPQSIVHQIIKLERHTTKILSRTLSNSGSKESRQWKLKVGKKFGLGTKSSSSTLSTGDITSAQSSVASTDTSNHNAQWFVEEKPVEKKVTPTLVLPKAAPIYASGMVHDISQLDFLTKCRHLDGVTVVHFHHEDFASCPIIDHQIRTLAAEFGRQDVKFARLCGMDAPFVTMRLKIWRFPTVLLLRKGEVLARCTEGDEELSDILSWLLEVLGDHGI